MAGSVFDYTPDPDEDPSGRGFAAIWRGVSAATAAANDDPDRSGQVNLPNDGMVDTTEGVMPSERQPTDDERGMISEPAPVGKDDQPFYSGTPAPAPAGPSSPDVYLEGQYGSGDPLPQLKPYGDHSADTAAMQAQKASEDPSKFKASGWRRALAGIAGGMVAAGSRDPAAGWKVGEGVLNAPLDRAKMQWSAQEAPLQAKIEANKAEDLQTYRTNQGIEQAGRLREQDIRNRYYGNLTTEHARDFAAQAEQRRNAITGFTPDDPKDRNSLGTGTTADGRTIKGAQPPAWYQDKWDKDPTNKGTAAMKEGMARVKAMKEAGIQLSAEDEKIVASGGKITPTTHTTVSILENPDGSARTPRGSAGPKNPDENVEAIVAKSTQDKQAFADQWERVDAQHADAITPEGSYQSVDGTKRISAAEFQSRIDKFRTDANVKLTKYGARMDEKGNVQRQAAPAQAPAAPGTPQGWSQNYEYNGEQPEAPARPAPAAPAQPAGGGGDTVALKGPGFSLTVPKSEAREGRVAFDEKGRKWMVKGGALVPVPGSPAGNGR